MINKQFQIQGVPRKEIDLLEDILDDNLSQTHRFEHSGLASDQGESEHPFATLKLNYGLKHLFRTTPVIDLVARGQIRQGAFTLQLNVHDLPEEVYGKITAALEKAPTIQAYLGQSHVGK